MKSDAKATIVPELVAEFVEERVRQFPTKSFALADVTRALTAMLRDSGAAVDLKRVNDAWLSEKLDQHFEKFLERFDWHSQVTVHFASGKGGAGWNRSKRTITVNDEYIHRFNTQGALRAKQASE